MRYTADATQRKPVPAHVPEVHVSMHLAIVIPEHVHHAEL